MICDLETSIPDWIIEYPATENVFKEFDLDASCGGKSLQYVCYQKGISPESVLEQLMFSIRRSNTADEGSINEQH